MYEIKTEDVYDDFSGNKEMFDFSNYSTKSKYHDDLLNKKFLRHSISWIQSKDHKIGTYEINKASLSCVDDTKYIQNNRCAGLAHEYQN